MNQAYIETSRTAKGTKLYLLIALLISASLMLSLLLYKLVSPQEETYVQQSLKLPSKEKASLVESTSSVSLEPIILESVLSPILLKNTITKTSPKEIPQHPEAKHSSHWQYLTVHSGDTLSAIFKRANLSSKTLQTILNKNKYAKVLTRIKPGQEIQILTDKQILVKMIIPHTQIESLVIELKKGQYITHTQSQPTHIQNKLITATVHGSLYSTAKRNNIPFKLIQQMTTIFNREIDFAKDIRGGDQFTILYKAHYINQSLVDIGDILAVTYTNDGHTYQAIRHELSNGESDYYTPEGKSLKQAFSRYPVQFSHISSMFSLSRMHPILRYRRPHQGVDLAAPMGTPIHATGDGRIETIEHHSTYGNVIKISHQNAYTSVYAHMHHFQKGLMRGSKVKRGQIIGYVGQSGLADGPHCHYEFHVNGLPINPSTVVLPRAAAVPKQQYKTFRNLAQRLLAQIKLFEMAKLSPNKKSNRKVA